MQIEDVVDRAVNECIDSGILRSFLTAHKSEVKAMYLAEFDETAFKKGAREEGRVELLTSFIITKIKKGKTLEVIAEEVEETPDAIREIYEKLIKELPNA